MKCPQCHQDVPTLYGDCDTARHEMKCGACHDRDSAGLVGFVLLALLGTIFLAALTAIIAG